MPSSPNTPGTDRWQAFRADEHGVFVDRPNRFVARVSLGTKVVEAHCPNPGRLTELLFPGAPVVLERAPTARKLAFTLVAVGRPGPGGTTTVPLVSVRANGAVGALVLPRLFPGATLVRPEFALEGSRFDWYVEDAAGRHLVEVKACSEIEFGSALFPDAPSARAVKHLEELARWGTRGYHPHVLFAVTHGRPRFLAPNHHTDPVFARTLAALAPVLDPRAVVFATHADGTTTLVDPALPVFLGGVPAAGVDEGLVVRLEPANGRWTVHVDAYDRGWSKAAARVPARTSFALGISPGHRDAVARDLGADYAVDPRTDLGFVAAVMRWRHQFT